MRYENNGVEIQYRECQILRDAAKELLAGGEDTKHLVDQRDKWIQKLITYTNNSINIKVMFTLSVPSSTR